jgi:hypothetical protein
MSAERALAAAIRARAMADSSVKAALGDPARLYDDPPPDPVFPYLTIGRVETRPADASGVSALDELHNRARGEVMLRVGDAERRLCVTLGALAELEAAFDVNSFTELGERLGQLTAGDLLIVLAALVSGGGELTSTRELAASRIDPHAAAAAVTEAFRLAFDDNA